MDSYVSELEKQNEALKQLLSRCQRKVETLETKVWKWYEVKIVDQGSMTTFFTETNLEEVVFKILYPMMEDTHEIEEKGKFISIKCYVGSLLIWKHDLTRRKSTDGGGRTSQDWFSEFDVGVYPGYTYRIFKTYADYTKDLHRYAERLKERRERLHQRS
jgi:hypothetical protein